MKNQRADLEQIEADAISSLPKAMRGGDGLGAWSVDRPVTTALLGVSWVVASMILLGDGLRWLRDAAAPDRPLSAYFDPIWSDSYAGLNQLLSLLYHQSAFWFFAVKFPLVIVAVHALLWLYQKPPKAIG